MSSQHDQPVPPAIRRRKPGRRVAIAGLIFLVVVFALGHRYVRAAWSRLTLRLDRLEGPREIRYQDSFKARAERVAEFYDECRAGLESSLGFPVAPMRVICIANEADYSAYTAAPGSRGCSTVLGDVCLSPRIEDEREELRRIVTHEMTHAAVQQQLGVWTYLRHSPAWFDEGLAVSLSGGGGAEKVTPGEARQAIRDGRRFDPSRMGKVYADSFDLSPHLFYRQSALFVDFLNKRRPGATTAIIGELKRGLTFPDAFERALGASIGDCWIDFVAEVTANH
jgi:hypothetical protein